MGDLFDTSQIDRLAIDLEGAPKRIQFNARRTMKKSALQILRREREEFSGHRSARGVPASFEMQQLDGIGLSWEIGELDSAGPQWGIAAILAYGTSNNAPVADHRKPLREEAPIMISMLGADAQDAVLGGPE